MRFWDSSAIISLCLKEKTSEAMKHLLKDDEDIVVWWITRIECLSALSRRQREGVLPLGDEAKARAVLSVLSATWSEIQPTEAVRVSPNVRPLSIASLMAEAMKRIADETSVSSLFD